MASAAPGSSTALRDMVNAYRVSQAIRVAAVLGIADHLAGGPRTSNELAMLSGAHPDALYRLLRALAAVGVLQEEGDRRFRLTPLGDSLRQDAPDSIRDWALFATGDSQWHTWQELEYSVRTGENGFRHLHGTDSWTYRQQHPDANAEFDLAMASIANLAITGLLPAYDFGRFATIVDVGGGNGTLLAAILEAHPATRGVLLDQPHVVAGAGPVLERAGVTDRCEIVPGDFFASVPTGGDAYILKSIIHDWEDAEAIAILRTCRTAMREGTALLLIERDLGGPNELPENKFSDLNMLLGPGGRERSLAEYERLFEAAGFRCERFVPGSAGFGVFEGVAQ